MTGTDNFVPVFEVGRNWAVLTSHFFLTECHVYTAIVWKERQLGKNLLKVVQDPSKKLILPNFINSTKLNTVTVKALFCT